MPEAEGTLLEGASLGEPLLRERRKTPAWKKTLVLIPCYFWLSLLRTSEFKFNFYSYLLMYGTQIVFYVFFWTAVAPPPASGWTAEACMLLTGFGTLNVAIQEIVWATGMVDQMVLQGHLMVVLVRPENSYFGLVMRRMAAMSLLPASMGLGLIFWVSWGTLDWEWWAFGASLFCCFMGSVTFRAILLAVNTLGFTWGKVSALKGLVLGGRDLARFPLDVLPGAAVALLSSLLPVMMMTNWPVQILLAENEGFAGSVSVAHLLGLSIAICVFWVLLCVFMWKRGLRHHEAQSL